MSATGTAALPATVGSALAAARALGLERLDAQRLLGQLLGQPRSWLLAHADDALAADVAARYRDLTGRRAGGEPMAYLIGEQEFFGLRLKVTPAVLIPRPDTETLVNWALALLAVDRPSSVADLGTGSGAIALAIAHQRPQAQVTAVDRSAEALAVARDNGRQLGLAVEWVHSDWFGALAGRRFDLLVSNPPYIAQGDPHLAALSHEPSRALTSGADGLTAIREIVRTARAHLQPGGWLLLEHGWDQGPTVAALLTAAGYAAVASRSDLAGHVRCTGGCRGA